MSGFYAGGIKGTCYAKIKTCYNTGKISGTNVGGICGQDFYTGVYISNCYNCGTISANNYGGGLIGLVSADEYGAPIIKNSYSTTYELIGYTYADTNAVETTITNSEGELTEATLKTMVDDLNVDIETDSYYIQDTNNINSGYPILSWQE